MKGTGWIRGDGGGMRRRVGCKRRAWRVRCSNGCGVAVESKRPHLGGTGKCHPLSNTLRRKSSWELGKTNTLHAFPHAPSPPVYKMSDSGGVAKEEGGETITVRVKDQVSRRC
jgi:hypothetical protein